MPVSYAGGFLETVDQVLDYEAAGLDRILLPEAYSFDAVSQLGFLAARTKTIDLVSSILNIYSRTPSLLAMTAAGLDYVSGGRFILGLGASGPQVVEGFHGVAYDTPLQRTREVADICRTVWRREPLDHHGSAYEMPLSRDRGGSGLGKPLKLVNTPVRPDIPLILAALGPKNVELAAELFEGWEPLFYLPEKADEAFGESLAAGLGRRDPGLGAFDVTVDTKLLICDDETEIARAEQQVREHLALYIGGMGARGRNFYNALAGRFGFEDAAAEIQDHFLAGRRVEAAAAVPDGLVHGVSLIGDVDHVKVRVAAFRDAGVTTLNAQPLAREHSRRVAHIGALKTIASS